MSGRRVSLVTSAPAQPSACPGTVLFLAGPAVPSCRQSMASCCLNPLPAPRSPPPRARCHSQLSAWQQQARREFQSSPGGAEAGGPLEPLEPGLCRPLPAGFTAQHTRSCCDYKRLLWAPGQERLGHCPHPSTLRGRGPGRRQPAGPAQHLSLPCPSVPRQTHRTSPWQVEPTQGTCPRPRFPHGPVPSKAPPGLPAARWAAFTPPFSRERPTGHRTQPLGNLV